MNNRVSPTLIGAFVVGALALVIIAILMFGSGQWFRKTKEFVLYFDSSVNGLRVGAPVKLKGVEIGSVKNILLRLDKGMTVKRIPVIIEIDMEKLISKGTSGSALNDATAFKEAIDHGLRGQLQLESFVTGLLFIGLDFFPDSPAKFAQNSEENGYPYPEIPTQPTTLQMAGDKASQIIAKLEEVDLKGLIDSFAKTAQGIEGLVNSPDLKRAVHSLDELETKVADAATNIAKLATALDGKMKVLSDDIQLTSAEVRAAINQTGATIKQTEKTIKEAEAVMAEVRVLVDPESPTFYQISKTLKEVSAAARSLRQLAGYVERNPRALIFGKPENRED